MRSLISVSEDLTFSLSNSYFSYVFKVSAEKILEHLYYGDPLSEPYEIPNTNRRIGRHGTVMYEDVPNYSLNDTALEYPSFGRSDFRYPAFSGQNPDGNGIFSLHYVDHKIINKKPDLDGLPSARGDGAQTLIVTLKDSLYELFVDVIYTIWTDHHVLSRSVKFRNLGTRSIQLESAYSTTLNFPAEDFEVQHFYGSWAREFNEERIKPPKGRLVIESLRGTSSAAHNPYLAILQSGASETQGRCYGTTLVYSGNFSIQVETSEFEDLRLTAGINPFTFRWILEPGGSFSAPEALHAFSSRGLGGLSRGWHDFIREKITPERFKSQSRPTYLNTWEAAYFEINEEKVLTLADKAKDIGVDMLVLDDGWFEGRRDSTSSLGDWRADKERFPSGISALAARVKDKGLKFGLWFEPEMVSPDSDLFRTHPDWIVGVPDRRPSLGRNQLTLDLSRTVVRDFLFDQLNRILSCGDIDYVKWDMNRNMSEVGSRGLPTDRQGEVSHRYMLGLYDLLERLTTAFPNILFENCASGGNRFDLGMLYYMPQGWISDMCDPIGRLSIINGASHLYPLDVMSAYIGPSPNHQNGRETSLETRFMAGIFCPAKGVSLSEADIESDREQIRNYMTFAKTMSEDMLGGNFYRLEADANSFVWQYVTPDEPTLYVAYFHLLSAPNLPRRFVRLQGLDPNAHYQIEESSERYKGDFLMRAGLPLPQVSTGAKVAGIRYMPDGDFTSHLFVFRKMAG